MNAEQSALGILLRNPQGSISWTTPFSDSGQSKVKPSQVNIEPGVKTPPDTIHK